MVGFPLRNLVLKLSLMSVLLFSFSVGLSSSQSRYFSTAYAQSTQPLSNDLPRAFVELLFVDGLWLPSFDQPQSPDHRDLASFWGALQSLPGPEKLPEKLVDELFGFMKDPSLGQSSSKNLYPVKFRLLRFLVQPSDRDGKAVTLTGSESQLIQRMRPQVVQIYERWLNRYLEMALALISVGDTAMQGGSEYQTIVEDFRQNLLSGKIQVQDLSPYERRELMTQMQASHGERLDARIDSRAPEYQVVGVFNRFENYFALDFARPLEDTFTTFSHEIVHAEDPRLKDYLRTYQDLFPQVSEIVQRWALISSPSDQQLWKKLDFLGIIKTAFDAPVSDIDLKKGLRQQLVDQLQTQLKDQMQELKDRAQIAGTPKLFPGSDDLEVQRDLSVLRQWLKALVGLTLENEYRAQGLSIQMLAVLTYQSQVLLPSASSTRKFELFKNGDEEFAFRLSQSINPMPKFSREILTQMDARQDDAAMGSKMVLNLLQSLYYDEVHLFLSDLAGKDRNGVSIAARIQSAVPKQSETADSLTAPPEPEPTLPEWTEPGKYGLPTNPYQLITSIPTTAWVLGYKQRLQNIEADLRKLMEPIIHWRMGILDLHDLSVADWRRVGIWYQSNPAEVANPQKDPQVDACLQRLNQDALVSQETYARYFNPVEWSSDPGASVRSVRADDIMKNLVRHRMIRALMLLKQLYPILRRDLLALRLIDQKLMTRKFLKDHGDFTAEKIQDLRREIEYTESYVAIGIKNDVLTLSSLLETVGTTLKAFAEEKQWITLAEAFSTQINRIFVPLRSIYGGKDFNQIVAEIKATSNFLREQLASEMKQYPDADCPKLQKPGEVVVPSFKKKKSYFAFPYGAGQTAQFTMDTSSPDRFPLMLTCHAGQVFAVRTPCDLGFLTRTPDYATPLESQKGTRSSNARDYAVSARIGFGGRNIILSPVDMGVEPEESGESDRKKAPRSSQKPRKGFFSRVFGG